MSTPEHPRLHWYWWHQLSSIHRGAVFLDEMVRRHRLSGIEATILMDMLDALRGGRADAAPNPQPSRVTPDPVPAPEASERLAALLRNSDREHWILGFIRDVERALTPKDG